MSTKRRLTIASCLFAVCVANGSALAQSDPSGFTTVYNIGIVTPGSPLDIPTAVTGASVGDGSFPPGDAGEITPTFLTGDVLGSDSQLNLFDGGTIESNFSVGPLDGSGVDVEVNVLGGTFRFGSEVNGGATVNIFGGDVDSTTVFDGGTVNVFGGDVGGQEVFDGGTVNVFGGNLASSLDVFTGASYNIFGGAFELDGSAVSELTGVFGATGSEEVLTGLYADGTVFIYAEGDADDFAAGTVTLNSDTVAPSTNPGTLSSGTFGKGVRAGETLTVNGSGELIDDFAVVGGTLNFESGVTQGEVAIASGVLNVSGGCVEEIDAFAGAIVNISGGSVGSGTDANLGSIFNISGGTLDTLDINTGSLAEFSGGSIEDLSVEDGGVVDITGGSVSEALRAEGGGTVNLSGGSIERLRVSDGSTVNLLGTAFFLDGVEINGLAFGEELVITDRDVTLSGILADGSAFEFDLNSSNFDPNLGFGADFFDPAATLTVTLVPEPSSLALLGLGGLLVARRRRASGLF